MGVKNHFVKLIMWDPPKKIGTLSVCLSFGKRLPPKNQVLYCQWWGLYQAGLQFRFCFSFSDGFMLELKVIAHISLDKHIKKG